jgi:hypothetical protein
MERQAQSKRRRARATSAHPTHLHNEGAGHCAVYLLHRAAQQRQQRLQQLPVAQQQRGQQQLVLRGRLLRSVRPAVQVVRHHPQPHEQHMVELHTGHEVRCRHLVQHQLEGCSCVGLHGLARP